MDFGAIIKTVQEIVIQAGFKIIGALLIYIVGRWLIGLIIQLAEKALGQQRVDATLIRYGMSILSVAANIALVVAILGYFGVETTTFAALVAGVGIAIGAAWGGLLSNFAAGAFLVVLRPFKVGDFICAGGTTGTVREVGLFVTTIDTPDNIQTFVGNNKIFSDNIQNFSANPYRRVELVAQLGHSVNPNEAAQRLLPRLAQIPNVLTSPAPVVTLLEFNPAGTVLAVRPFCNNAHYWQVYFDTNRLIHEVFGEAGYPTPAPQFFMRN